MTDQQPERPRPREEPEPQAEAEQAPPPWPSLGSNWREAPEPPLQAPAWEPAPPAWQPPPAYQQGPPPPAYVPHGHPPAPRYYPGARIPDSEARNWAVMAHLSPLLASIIGLPFLGPLVVWLSKRNDHPYVAEQAREALNFNLSMFIYSLGISVISFIGLFLVVGILGFVFLGLILLPLWLVLIIVGAVKAGNGEAYRYPFTMRMVD